VEGSVVFALTHSQPATDSVSGTFPERGGHWVQHLDENGLPNGEEEQSTG
jgi:hypothetical protein